MAWYSQMTIYIDDFASQIDDLETEISKRQLRAPEAKIFYDHLISIYEKTKEYEMKLKTGQSPPNHQTPAYLSAIRQIYTKAINLKIKLTEIMSPTESTSSAQPTQTGFVRFPSEQAELSKTQSELRSLQVELSNLQSSMEFNLSRLETLNNMNSRPHGYDRYDRNDGFNRFNGYDGYSRYNSYDRYDNTDDMLDSLEENKEISYDIQDEIYRLEDIMEQFMYDNESREHKIQDQLDEILAVSKTQKRNCKCMKCDPINGSYPRCIRNSRINNNSTGNPSTSRYTNMRSYFNPYNSFHPYL